MPIVPHLVDLAPWHISADAATSVVIAMSKRQKHLARKAGASDAFIAQLEREIHILAEFIGISEATIRGLEQESRDEFGRIMRQIAQEDSLKDWADRVREAISSPDFATRYPALLAERTDLFPANERAA